MKKVFFKPKEEIIELLLWNGPAGCIASDRIMVDGLPVGYMYREEPDNDSDSGWRFFAGDEDDDYCSDPDKAGIYHLNTVCNSSSDIIPFLDSPYGTAFFRNEEGVFEEEDFEPSADDN